GLHAVGLPAVWPEPGAARRGGEARRGGRGDLPAVADARGLALSYPLGSRLRGLRASVDLTVERRAGRRGVAAGLGGSHCPPPGAARLLPLARPEPARAGRPPGRRDAHPTARLA